MFDNVLRTTAGVIAMPAAWAAGALQRVGSSHGVLLEVVVSGTAELRDRQELLDALRLATTDDRVLACIFRIDASPGGWAAATDLREAIGRLKAARIHTTALLENPGNVGLWLASECDRVVMVPSGQVLATGIGVELTFFARALERIGVSVDVEAAGAFKAAGEPVTRSFSSPQNRLATRALIDGLHRRLVGDVASSRRLDVAEVQDALAMGPLSASDAKERGLVDALQYPDELRETLTSQFGKQARRVPLRRWVRLARTEQRLSSIHQWPGVAVLHLQGSIVLDGQPGAVCIAARQVVPLLRRLREASGVAGVVLHVNSPGGSAYASDLIWREVDLIVRDKPVVACFEDVSASGGYYLSAPATHIIARPSTITGSIGVVGGKLVAADVQRKLGVYSETLATAPNATMFSPSARFTPSQRERFRASLQDTYDGFVHRVASGRRRPVDQLEPHCRGRVWLGDQALAVGLVDKLGNVDTAVAQVERLASQGTLKRLHLTGHARPSYFARQVQRRFRDALPMGVSAAAQLVGATMGPAATSLLTHPGEPLALWPYDLGYSLGSPYAQR